MIAKEFWKDKKVFLTGHTGFKGSWLAHWLTGIGADVRGYSLDAPTHPNLFEALGLAEKVDHLRGDIRDGGALSSAMGSFDPDIAFHLAAQPLVRESYAEPLGTFQSNVLGMANFLEGARACKRLRSVVVITTDKVYQNREWAWGYRENEAFGGYDPYSASKACAEIVAASYRDSFFNSADYGKRHSTAIATMRAGNVIGGGDWAADRLVPDCLKAFERGEKVRIRNPNSIRPWQHVLEPLSVYIDIAQRLYGEGPCWAEGWNVGPDDSDAKTVGWIVDRLRGIWGGSASFEIDDGEHPHEANYLKLDCSKIKSRTGWVPRWSLDEALVKVVDWHRGWLSGVPAAELCDRQIEEFSETVPNLR
jgi:CDP-glucose 4,6-dehydratase